MRKAANSKIKVSGKDMTLQILIYICMALAVFICIYPFWYLVIYSLSDSAQAIKGVWILPKRIYLLRLSVDLQEYGFWPCVFYLHGKDGDQHGALPDRVFVVCLSGDSAGNGGKEICLPLCDHHYVSGGRAGSILYYHEGIPFKQFFPALYCSGNHQCLLYYFDQDFY